MKLIMPYVIIFTLIAALVFSSCANTAENIEAIDDVSQGVNIYSGNWAVYDGNHIIFSDYPKGDVYTYNTSSDTTTLLFEGYHAYKLFICDGLVYFFNRSDICVYRYSPEDETIVNVTDIFGDIWLIRDGVIYGRASNEKQGEASRMLKYEITTGEAAEICVLDGNFKGFEGHRLAYSDSTFYKALLTDTGVHNISVDLNGEMDQMEMLADYNFSFVTKQYFYGSDEEGVFRINKNDEIYECIVSDGQILGVDGERVFYAGMENGAYSLYVWQSDKSALLHSKYPLSNPSLFDNKFHILDDWVYFLSTENLQGGAIAEPVSVSAGTAVYHYAISIDTKELVLMHMSDLAYSSPD
ncbi:MAG: hypothetical protein LBL09_00115 [Oscillospiraceae bacterium]|jgi:hypothetical protein|nr:hypothetical protein [Oscillospiraceae bacterium]